MPDSVQFLASYPPIQSAIKRGRDGVRLQLEIPLTEVDNAKAAFDWFDKVIEVTMQVGQSVTYGSTDPPKRPARSPLDLAGG